MAKGDWWFKFEFDKWNDENLRMCTLEAQGFWLRVYALMRKRDVYLIKASADDFARMFGCAGEEVERSIAELERTETANVTPRNALKRDGNSVVTLVSRERKAAISARKKTRLRVRKHRENADVTLEKRDRVKSNKKEVINNTEEKREQTASPSSPAPEKVPASSFGKPQNKPPENSLFNHPAIEAFRTVTKHSPPKESWPLLAEKIGTKVDLPRLTAVYAEWLASGNKPKNFLGVADWYLGERKFTPKEKTPGSEPWQLVGKNEAATDKANCRTCFDTREKMIYPKADSIEGCYHIPCPDCVGTTEVAA